MPRIPPPSETGLARANGTRRPSFTEGKDPQRRRGTHRRLCPLYRVIRGLCARRGALENRRNGEGNENTQFNGRGAVSTSMSDCGMAWRGVERRVEWM